MLGDRRYLAGEEVTLADVFLFPTLYRFDAVYHTHFKCNLKRLVDFENLWPYARDLYQLSGVAATCNTRIAVSHLRSSKPATRSRLEQRSTCSTMPPSRRSNGST